MAKKTYTSEELVALPLVGYERTREEANQLARDHQQETGDKCIVVNPNGTRARKGYADRPWQVRVKVQRGGAK